MFPGGKVQRRKKDKGFSGGGGQGSRPEKEENTDKCTIGKA